MKLDIITFIAAIMILLHRCFWLLFLIHIEYIIFFMTLHYLLIFFWQATKSVKEALIGIIA